MSLEITLQNAISGLQTSQQSLQIISNNIANVNVDGYTRKIISQTSRVIDGQGYGVDLAKITRNVDDGLLKKLRQENGELKRLTVRDQFLEQVNAYFGRPEDNSSLTHVTADFASQLDSLSVTPEAAATQFLAVKSANDVLKQLDNLSNEVQRLRSEANRQLGVSIDDFNTQMDAVKDLNSQLIEFNASNVATAELEDQRDIALNKMAEQMDIQYFEKSDGSYTVFTGAGKTLIDGTTVQDLSYNQPAALTATLEYTPTNAVNYLGPSETGYPVGSVPGIFVGENLATTDVTNDISSGKMKGLIQLRDVDLPAIQKQLDEFAEKLKDEINKVHNQGTGFPPPATLTGTNFVQSTTNIDASTGLVRIGVVDEDGNQIEAHTLDLTNFTTVGNLVSDGSNGINDLFSSSNLVASVTSDGELQLAAGGNYRVAINSLDSSMTSAGKQGRGFSDFFGLNNLFTSPENFAQYRTDAVTSQTGSVITTGGTLQFTASGLNTTVSYVAGDSLTDLETAINNNSTLSSAGITAEVVADGDVYRLQVTDSGGDDFQMTETGGGSLLSDTNIRTDNRGISTRLSVRSDIEDNVYYMSRGQLQSNTWLSSTSAHSFATATDVIGNGNATLTFTGSGFSASVAYDATTDYDSDGTPDTISDLAAAINQDATLQAQNITASVIFDNSSGEYQVKISDGDGDSFDLDDGNLITIENNQGVTIGDGSAARDMAAVFESTVSFNAAPAGGGGLAQADTTFSGYSASILSFNSAQASSVKSDLTFQDNLTTELFNKNSSISSVNMDEELSNMIIYEQAYLASARMITTTTELFKELANAV